MSEFETVTLRCVAEVEGDGRTVTSLVAILPEAWETATATTRDTIKADVRRQLLGTAQRQLGFELNADDVLRVAVTVDAEPAQIGSVRRA